MRAWGLNFLARVLVNYSYEYWRVHEQLNLHVLQFELATGLLLRDHVRSVCYCALHDEVVCSSCSNLHDYSTN